MATTIFRKTDYIVTYSELEKLRAEIKILLMQTQQSAQRSLSATNKQPSLAVYSENQALVAPQVHESAIKTLTGLSSIIDKGLGYQEEPAQISTFSLTKS